MQSRMLAVGLAVAVAIAGCGGDDDNAAPSSVATTTSTVAVTTTQATTTSTVATTSTSSLTTVASTSTTVPPSPGVALVLRADRLGTARFGADPDGVVDYVSSILGAKSSDTGWVDPFTFGVCPGTEVRVITWDDLVLFFSDESIVLTGTRHFFAYHYGPMFAATIEPSGLATIDGIGVGSTLAELRATYPSVAVNIDDELGGSTFEIEPGLIGFLSGGADTDVITSFVGGIGCGE